MTFDSASAPRAQDNVGNTARCGIFTLRICKMLFFPAFVSVAKQSANCRDIAQQMSKKILKR